jgi:inorganic phosphate transporter, PiT family
MPVSTTHVVSAAIMGVGTARNSKGMRWDIVEQILWAWVFTLPVSGLLAFGFMQALRFLGWATPPPAGAA